MTAFTDLPDLGNGLRLVGSCVMDEEQFTVEGWFEYRGNWIARLDGIHNYAALREKRRQDRHRSWAARNEEDEAFSRHINSQIEDRRTT